MIGVDGRCKYWELEVNDGPYEPLSGTAGSLIASMGSVAVGFGTMIAAPPKALYSFAKTRRKACDSDTWSLDSEKSSGSFDNSRPSRLRPGGVEMKKSHSDSGVQTHIHREESTAYKTLKKELGQQGLGRVLKATVDGILLEFCD